MYLIMRPKHKLDIETQEKNSQLQKEVQNKEQELQILKARQEELEKSTESLKEKANQYSADLYAQAYETMQERLSQSADYEAEKYRKTVNSYKSSFREDMASFAAEYQTNLEKLKAIQEEIQEEQKNLNIAIEESRKRLLEESKREYYKIQISEDSLHDIQLLREIASELKCDAEPLNKVIWESYYKLPTTELLNRIIPSNKVGIYKITNLQTQQCYIGQSRNLRDRLRNHIKAGLGLDSSSNKFYTELKKLGPENFTYEILEECPAEKLNEKEKYWIAFFSSTIWGYNTVKGVSKKC